MLHKLVLFYIQHIAYCLFILNVFFQDRNTSFLLLIDIRKLLL